MDASRALPQIRGKRLFVDGEPFIMLSGELHNSSASSLEYMKAVWPRLKAMHLNSVIATVSWELLEPEEGAFDFALVDGLIEAAQAYGMKLALCWFATWKNAASTYVPKWVKTDFARFPRAKGKDGKINRAISCFSKECMEADARAFAALMRHLKETDKARTVILVQVENEAGLLDIDRDYSKAATEAFTAPVPKALADYLKKHEAALSPFLSERVDFSKLNGSWAQAFTKDAEEIFMAFYTALFMEHVTHAGKQMYALPMYANAWTVQSKGEPGGFHPSGGPVADLHDIWRCAAPSLDALAPDLYLENFKQECAAYTRIEGNPLLIPELRRDQWAVASICYAIGEHDAICVAPFGIDGMSAAELSAEARVQDAAEVIPAGSFSESIQSGYQMLENMLPIIIKHQGKGTMHGIMQDRTPTDLIRCAAYDLKVRYNHPISSGMPLAGGIVIALDEQTFLVAGMGFSVTFISRHFGETEYVLIDEGAFEGEDFVAGRRLNGDELGVSLKETPKVLKVQLFSYNHD